MAAKFGLAAIPGLVQRCASLTRIWGSYLNNGAYTGPLGRYMKYKTGVWATDEPGV